MEIPNIGLGTSRLHKNNAYNITLAAINIGYKLIDTASLYNNEEYIGKAIIDSKINRKELFICTKIQEKDIMKPDGIRNSIIKSLNKLKSGYIDLILLHWPPINNNDIIEKWRILEDFINNEFNGKIRFIGTSNYNINQLDLIIKNCKIMPYANQIELSPFCQRKELVEYCQKNNIKIMAHSSLTRGEKLNDDKLLEISKNNSVANLLLSWAISKNYIIIPRTCNQNHLIENFHIKDSKIDDNIIRKLDEISDNYIIYNKFI